MSKPSNKSKQGKQENVAERRKGFDRRKLSFGYDGPERRSGADRRK